MGSSSIRWRGSLCPWHLWYCGLWLIIENPLTSTKQIQKQWEKQLLPKAKIIPATLLAWILSCPDMCPHSHREMLHWILSNSCSLSKDTGKSPYTWDIRPLFERERNHDSTQNFGPSSFVRAKHKRSFQLLEWKEDSCQTVTCLRPRTECGKRFLLRREGTHQILTDSFFSWTWIGSSESSFWPSSNLELCPWPAQSGFNRNPAGPVEQKSPPCLVSDHLGLPPEES